LQWAGWSGDSFLEGARFYTPIQAGPGAHPTTCTILSLLAER